MLAPEKILVVRLSSLGDVIMTLPAVYSLKRALPNSKIHWVCEGSACDLLLCMDFIDEVVRFPREKILNLLLKGKIKESAKHFADFLKLLRKKEFDLVIDFHGILRSVIICMFSRKKKLIGFGRPYAKEYSHLFYDEVVTDTDPFLHKVKRNMLVLRRLNIKECNSNIPFVIPQEERSYVDSFFREEGISFPVFAINPFSSKRGLYKRWPLKKYVELIKRIQNEIGANVVVLWGSEEEKKEAKKIVELFKNGVFLSWPMSVPKLLDFLSRVDMYIGGDSGVTHVAALAGAPVIAIFGPTDERINSPYGHMVRILKKTVPCRPCKKRNCKQRSCLESISPDDVFDALNSIYVERNFQKNEKDSIYLSEH